MLTELLIAGAGSYCAAGQRLHTLRQANFLFGANGSGKTTISRALAAPDNHPACQASWAQNQPLECRVYNSDFARANFAEATAPGIFTLGQESVQIREKIAAARTEVQDYADAIGVLQATRDGTDRQGGKSAQLAKLRGEFEEACWKYKVAHDPHFADAFEGLRNSKSRFCDRMLSEKASNAAVLHAIDALKPRAAQVFEKGIEKLAPLPPVRFDDLIAIETVPVLAKKVVGKDDIDIAGLIRRLGNSDWVKQGLGYVSDSDAPCPFCQQELPPGVLDDLNAYFDETYVNDLANVERAGQAYETLADLVLKRLQALAASGNRYLDEVLLQAEIDRLSDRLTLNGQHLARKRREASLPVTLEPIGEITETITALIAAANAAIAKHNATFDDLGAAKTTLTSEIWKAVVEDAAGIVGPYVMAQSNLEKAITGLDAGLADKRQKLAEATAALRDLEHQVTSAVPTVTDINATLTRFGFTNFRLATTGDRSELYKIVRADGSDAAQTLSEGEKGFVTFLYFYNWIRGSVAETGLSTDRIVIFDDPVSSFDSDVLFLVSALIRSLVDEACRGDGQVKQVFVLTHNIYFHKEVTYDHKNARRNKTSYWIVRKLDDQSTLAHFPANPIRTSYQLLWDELKEEPVRKATIQNTLRRILENYFTILGGIDRDDIIGQFVGHDQMICASLFSWVNDGSHSVHDDLYVLSDDSVIERYLRVFREIFDKTQHGAHYRMMLGLPAAPVVMEVVPDPVDAGPPGALANEIPVDAAILDAPIPGLIVAETVAEASRPEGT